jgi:hypothetical protein
MSRAEPKGASELSPGPAESGFTRETVLEVLSNQRRRYALHYLKHRSGDTVDLRELSERVASWEQEKSVKQLSYQERKRVQNALRQFHLPKMDDCGFVEYDATRGTTRLTDGAAEQEFYVDVLPKRGIPWGLYYLGLSAVSVVSLAAGLSAVYPLSLFTPTLWCVFFATTLTVSSVGHFYDNYYRMRMGTREKPPEVN